MIRYSDNDTIEPILGSFFIHLVITIPSLLLFLRINILHFCYMP